MHFAIHHRPQIEGDNGKEDGVKKQVSLYQLTGQQLMSVEVQEREFRFNLENYAKGIFVAKVISQGKVKVIKFEKSASKHRISKSSKCVKNCVGIKNKPLSRPINVEYLRIICFRI